MYDEDEELEAEDYEPDEIDDEEPKDSTLTALGHARRGHPEPDAREVFAALMSAGGEAEAPEPPGPTNWRAIPAEEAPEAWEELRAWVEELVRRYASFDHHVVPACWFRHNSHVEALAALRDYEGLAFFPSSPASSPYNFQIALAQIEARLREWTARAGCLGEHREQPPGLVPPNPDEWAAWVAQDQDFRKKASYQDVREDDPEQ